MPSLTLLLIIISLLSIVAYSESSLIKNTCKMAKHFDLCVSSLDSDPASRNASDATTLALLMIAHGVANSTATSAFLSAANNISTAAADSRECAEDYAFAADALRAAARDLGSGDGDYAYVHVSAAADYPRSCRNAFLGRTMRGYYPPEVAAREDGLKRICDIVLGIIDHIIATLSFKP